MSPSETIDQLAARNIDTIAKIERALVSKRSRGERIADHIAFSIGSWPFIVFQSATLFLWMILNIEGWVHRWDPFPFILLNLALSFQAAFAGPIIMMSQNRQARFSEQRNELDLQINLLAEQENTEMLRLRLLCQKSGVPPEQLSKSRVLAQETNAGQLLEQIANKHETGRQVETAE